MKTIIAILLFAISANAADFYVDSDVLGGAHDGKPASPACSVYQIAPSIVATANAGQDAVVHFSAREAASDVDDVYTGNSSSACNGGGGSANRIDMLILRKTGTGRIVFDGHFWNTSDAVPNWLPYTGNSKPVIYSIFAQNGSHLKINDVTVDGIRIIAQSEKGISICGDNWIVRNNDIAAVQGSTNGPLLLIVPTADGAHEGSSEWCPPSSNILIENNSIHDSLSELIYVGGAGCTNADPLGAAPNCGGFPGHSNITIRNNKLTNGGIWGGEGDGIDLKAGIVNVTITGNEISKMGGGARAIVTQGQNAAGIKQNYRIENNNIHDNPTGDGAVVLANSWGTPNGMVIQGNTITNSGTPVMVYAGTDIVVAGNGQLPPVIIPPIIVPDPPVDTLPVPGYGGSIAATPVTGNKVMLSWAPALGDSPRYEVRRSVANNMATVADAELNGTVMSAYSASPTSYTVTGLASGKTYYFTVIVQTSGGKAVYKTKQATK